MTLPFCGLFLALSGSRSPPAVFSSASKRLMTMRSPSGFTFMVYFLSIAWREQKQYPIRRRKSKFHALKKRVAERRSMIGGCGESPYSTIAVACQNCGGIGVPSADLTPLVWSGEIAW